MTQSTTFPRNIVRGFFIAYQSYQPGSFRDQTVFWKKFTVFKNVSNHFLIPSKATDDKGFGVFAGSFIPKGSFITTYLGRYVSSETEKQSTKMRVYKHNIGQVFLGSNSWETNFYAQAYNVSNY